MKQDTILRQLEGRKAKKNKKEREEEEAMMRKQLDQLNAKLSKINSEIQEKSQHKEQKLQVRDFGGNTLTDFVGEGDASYAKSTRGNNEKATPST